MDLNPKQQQDRLRAIHQMLSDDPIVSVLVIEDNRDDAHLAQSILKSHGVDSDVASDCHGAETALVQKRYGLIFMDWKLIGVSGLDALKTIKEVCPKIPVVILTGVASNDDSVKALEYGAVAVMRKPLSNEDINLIFRTPT